MNKRSPILAASVLALAGLIGSPEKSSAFTYADTQLLLVFKSEGYDDVIFNIGSVSNYLGRAAGTVLNVTNFSLPAVVNNFGADLTGVKFALMATTSPTVSPVSANSVWLTSLDPEANPLNVTYSKYTQIYSKVSAVGQRAQEATFSSATNYFRIGASQATSYTTLSGGVDTLDGQTTFAIEGAVPATTGFYQVQASSLANKPVSMRVGSFQMTSGGLLSFIAGASAVVPPPAPTITAIARAAGVATVSFSTTNGVSYRLRYATQLGGSITNWQTLPTVVTGNNAVRQIQDTTADAVRFYGVEAFK